MSQISNCQHPLHNRKSKRIPEENFCFTDYAKAFDCIDYTHTHTHKPVENSSTDGNTRPPYCHMRNLYVGQEVTVRTRHGTIGWFKIGKGEHQGCRLSPWLFNFYAEYIMWNARLDESQAEIKIDCKNINSLIYADDMTLMVESEEELNSLLMRVKEESEKYGLKLNIQKTKIMISSPITLWQIDRGKVQTVTLYFLGIQNHCGRRL